MKQTLTANQSPAGHVHIDRMTFSGPLDHEPKGELIFKHHPDYGLIPVGASALTPQRRRNPTPVDMFIKSHQVQMDERAYAMRFDCCPPQILQGHNFFGHQDIRDYAYSIFDMQTSKLGIPVADDERACWQSGRLIHTSQVHLTANFWIPSHLKRPVIDAIDAANSRGKHRDIETCISLGYNASRRSTHHTACIYDKWALLNSLWTSPGEYQRLILPMAMDSIRIEMRLHEGGLAARSLKALRNWEGLDIDALFFELLASYNIRNAIQPILTPHEESELSKPARIMYLLWLYGEELEPLFSRSKIWTYQQEIKEVTTLDIKSHRRPDALPVVDLSEVLTPQNIVPLPDWAVESGRYWRSTPMNSQ